MQPCVQTDFPGTKQCIGVSILVISHPIILVECRNVPWDIGGNRKEVVCNILKPSFRIVEIGDDQRYDLKPDFSVVNQLNGVEDIPQNSSQLAV